jgi:hypothetical protein
MRDERGSVTAEYAAALPAVVLLLALVLTAFSAGAQAVRLQDAAGLAARGLARGEPAEGVARMVQAIVPGAALERRDQAELVCAVVTARSAGLLAGVGLEAESCALVEG